MSIIHPLFAKRSYYLYNSANIEPLPIVFFKVACLKNKT